MTILANILCGLATAVTGPDVWDLFLSVGLFATVVMAVLAIFDQPGKIELSPQREAAIATGHTDRRTVFEWPILRPLTWLLLAVAHYLPIPRLKLWLRRKLIAAGSPNYYTAEEYLALSLLAGTAMATLLEILYIISSGGRFSFFYIFFGLLFGTALGLYQMHNQAAKRVRVISKRVPYSLDLIALAMGAGATFIEAVRTIVRENPEDPFNMELSAMLAEIELGATRRRALADLADRVPLESLRNIVASIIQAEELGTPLAEVLHAQSTLLRQHRSVRAENAAAVASVRILVPSLLIVVAVILVVFGPMAIRMIRGGGLMP